jgi:hypothetical protein
VRFVGNVLKYERVRTILDLAEIKRAVRGGVHLNALVERDGYERDGLAGVGVDHPSVQSVFCARGPGRDQYEEK